MKKTKYIWLIFLFSLAGLPAQAADIKVGVVKAGLLMEKSPQKTKALARLESEFSSRSKSIERKAKALRAKQEKLAKDGAILGAEERKSRERTIVSEQRDIKRLQDEYSDDFSIRRNEELRNLEKEIANTIIEVAKKESYDLIVYQGVIFSSDRIDITDKVLKVLKSKAR